MADIEKLKSALLQAHNNGDEQAAQLFASQIKDTQSRLEGLTLGGQNVNEMNAGMRFVGGMKSSLDRARYGVEDLGRKFLGMEENPNMKRDLENGKLFYENSGTAGKVGGFTGEVAPYLIPGAALKLGAKGMIATQGLIGAAVTPGDAGDRAEGAAWAAGGEGVGRVLGKAIEKLVKPINPTQEAQRLIERGIIPTPGAAAGGMFKRMEDMATSTPLVGDAIQKGRRSAIEQGNEAAMNYGNLGAKASYGTDGFTVRDADIDNQFRSALKGVGFDINDPQFIQGVQRAMQNNNLTADGISAIETFLNTIRRNHNIAPPITNPNPGGMASAPGTALATRPANAVGQVLPNTPTPSPTAPPRQWMNGEATQDLIEALRGRSQAFRRNDNPYLQDTGRAFRDIYEQVMQGAERQGFSSPESIAAWKAARQQYAQYKPAMEAGSSKVTSRNDGIFTPAQYQSQVVGNMKKMGQTGALRRGESEQLQFANDMIKTLGNNYPDSGTAGRLLLNATLGMGASGYIGGEDGMMGLAGAGGAAYLMNTNAGRKYLVGELSKKQNQIAAALRNNAKYAGAVGAGAGAHINTHKRKER